MAADTHHSTTTWDSPSCNSETIWLIVGIIVTVVRTASVLILFAFPILVFAGNEEASCSIFFAKYLALYFLVTFVTLFMSAPCLIKLLDRPETSIPTMKEKAFSIHRNLYKFLVGCQLIILFLYEWACAAELAFAMGLILASFAAIDFGYYYVIKMEKMEVEV